MPLPIDPLIPDIIASLQRTPNVVLEAPPGAGKTTRVPRALLDAGVEGEILVLEPRRLAARMAARRVAEELGERVGERVGYRVRFDDAVSSRTRVVFVTEGVLTRRLLSDPELRGVGAVLLDEFHERHLQGDVALALLRRLQERRKDLKLAVMSATLDAGPIAAFLGCPSLRAEGRRFDVTIEYRAPAAQNDRAAADALASDVAAALRKLVADGLDGDVLVFLPGAAEIRKAQAACASVAAQAGIDVVMLHGDLKPEEQDRAVAPGPRRKVILSTNVAETSITIEGVVAVIDSGLARVASFSPWSGVPTLKVAKISRASATQRAGRAGRLRPGRALRLYSQHDHDTRALQDAPEVRRLDLTDPLLLLASSGVRVDELAWLEAPPAAAVEAARALLVRLGAIDGRDAITPLGRRMLRFPLHPRQARLVVDAEARGVGRASCVVAALVGERDLVWQRPRRAELSGDSDLLADLDRFAEASRGGGLQPDRARTLGLDVGAALTIDRVRRQLEPLVERGGKADDPDTALRQSILAGYPDRVARRRRKGEPELLLSGGGTAQLTEASVVRDADLMVVVDAEQRSDRASGAIVARSVTAIEADWLIDVAADRIREVRAYAWNAPAERVEVIERMTYDALVLDERRAWPSQLGDADADAVARALHEAARDRGTHAFVDAEALERLRGRVAFVRAHLPEAGLPELTEAELDAALGELCVGRDSFAELREGGFLSALVSRMGPQAAGLLAKEAPERVTLPGGRGVLVQYPAGQAPFIASRLQDFFGMAAGPTLARGRVPLTLHLLAPNQRAVQVTSDLAGFWERHYPALRRELGRRYPRHSWPEDPLHVAPPAPRPPRRS
ncbi:MAG TPA: ATP-dependent helicase HrpB [Polyangia bacterium]|nr:ATP-dependent helicase HrpB [Polyangia bacterium]